MASVQAEVSQAAEGNLGQGVVSSKGILPGLVRLGLAVAALGGLAWAGVAISREARTSEIRHVSTRMVRGEDFSPDTIKRITDYLDRTQDERDCASGALGPAAVVRVFMAFEAMGSASKLDPRASVEKAERDLKLALACAPYRPFLWFQAFWLRSQVDKEESLPFLEMSYKLGPNEGWIMPTRAARALPLLDIMPPELRDQVRREFVNLVRDDTDKAARIFLRLNSSTRNAALPMLAQVPLEKRLAFAHRLDAAGLDVEVPGVTLSRRP
jgi:hypothetical protein